MIQLHENLLREKERAGCLDLAMALKDQDRLFHSMKMKKLFPELIQSVEEEEKEEERREEAERRKERQKRAALEKEAAAKEAGARTWEPFNIHLFQEEEDEDEVEVDVEYDQVLSQEEREALARAPVADSNLLENYNAWESMFSKEMGGCREAGEASVGGRGRGLAKGKAKGLGTLTEEEDTADTCWGAAAASNTCTQVSRACTAHSTSASTGAPGRGKFTYEFLEPMKIITVRTFKVPTSFSAKQGRIRNPGFYKKESQAVDTSDLGLTLEEMPVWEEIQVRERSEAKIQSLLPISSQQTLSKPTACLVSGHRVIVSPIFTLLLVFSLHPLLRKIFGPLAAKRYTFFVFVVEIFKISNFVWCSFKNSCVLRLKMKIKPKQRDEKVSSLSLSATTSRSNFSSIIYLLQRDLFFL